jgi:hypothetical protein
MSNSAAEKYDLPCISPKTNEKKSVENWPGKQVCSKNVLFN